MGGKDRDDCAHNLILDGKDLVELAVIVLSPAVPTGHGIDELRRYVSAPTYAALQHVPHT
jgi:hypothetical protein